MQNHQEMDGELASLDTFSTTPTSACSAVKARATSGWGPTNCTATARVLSQAHSRLLRSRQQLLWWWERQQAARRWRLNSVKGADWVQRSTVRVAKLARAQPATRCITGDGQQDGSLRSRVVQAELDRHGTGR